MPSYRVSFINDIPRGGKLFHCCQRSIVIRAARNAERAVEAAKKRFARLEGSLIALVIGGVGVWTAVSLKGVGPGKEDYEYRMANGCSLDRSSAYDISIDCGAIIGGVEPEVATLGWNSEFVVASTHPVTKRVYPNNPENTYSEPDTSITDWWIVDLKHNQIHGPLQESAFQDEEKALGISGINMLSVDQAKMQASWVYGDGRN